MKNLFILACFFLTMFTVSAQIIATTSAGKKVVLNSDGTWKYADGSVEEKPCSTFHTGNITVTNNTGQDIYFYYCQFGLFGDPKYIRLKSKTTKTITDLFSQAPNYDGVFQYAWIATLELYEAGTYIKKMNGIESGNFMITDCETNDLDIGN